MKEVKGRGSKGAASGLVALVFLVLGFQLAIFVVKVVEGPRFRVEPGMTVDVEPGMTVDAGPRMTDGAGLPEASEAAGGVRSREHFSRERDESQSSVASGKRRPTAVIVPVRTYESFAFDPNTVSLDDLQRLGLTLRQAESIENYRSKGGRFRTKTDFQKMYVVSDTLYARLESFIVIAKIELNTADSTALVSLRGIGPYYAHKILEYRERLGGFLDVSQLLEIDGFGQERYDGMVDAVKADASRCHWLDLWNASDSVLARHPYLGAKGARSIARYKALYDSTRWTLADLAHERVLPLENIEKLKKYIEIQ